MPSRSSKLTLPPGTSDLAAQAFKDPYLFDFLGTAEPRREREIEQALINHLERFLLELGAGFAFVGRRELSFDPSLRQGFSQRQALEPDLLRAQQLIERASHVAWFFPTWWAGPPALVKGFIDRTFLPGWAFAYRGSGNGLPDALLRGRSARVVTTMDSPSFWYQLWHRGSLHGSFVNATLRYVGFGPVATTTLYGQRARTPAQRAAWLARLGREGEADAKRRRTKLELGAGTP